MMKIISFALFLASSSLVASSNPFEELVRRASERIKRGDYDHIKKVVKLHSITKGNHTEQGNEITPIIGPACPIDQASFLPGHTFASQGYNFLRDAPVNHNSQIHILANTETFNTKHRNTFLFNGVCYKLPDVFIDEADGTWGLNMDVGEASTEFSGQGSRTAYEAQHKESKKRNIEASLQASGFGYAAEAAFSHSSTTESLRAVVSESSIDSNQASAFLRLYRWQVKQAYPSDALVNAWINLYKNKDKYEAFREFFDSVGTHYYISTDIGGELKLSYSIRSSKKTTTTSTSESRSTCVSAKVSGTYYGINANVAGKVCGDSFEGDQTSTTVSDYSSNKKSNCIGGQMKCPSADIDDPAKGVQAREAWWQEVANFPAPISGGNKQWMFELMQRVVDNADINPTYASTLSKFGQSEDKQANKEKLTELISTFKTQLFEKHIGKEYYCTKVDPTDKLCNVFTLVPKEWPNSYMYVENKERGYLKAFQGAGDLGPGGQGSWILKERPNHAKTYLLAPLEWPDYNVYMEDNLFAWLKARQGDPGDAGYWVLDDAPNDPGYFLLTPLKWRDWHVYMTKWLDQWIGGWKGEPGNQGHWKITKLKILN